MPSFGGLISGVMGRTAEGYGKAADMEMKKQSELDLRKQLMEAETEKQLRIDEIKRGRDIVEEDRKMSPEYIAKVSAADLERGKGAIANRTTLAPLGAGADIAEGGAKLGVQMALAPAQAAAAKVTYDAGKPLDAQKAADAVIAKIAETKTLSEDTGYLEGTGKLSKAAKAAEIKMTQIRADAVKDKPSGGGSSTVKVRSTYTNSDGQKIAVMSDGSEKTLGKSSDYDKTLSNLVTKMAKDDYKFAKLPEAEKRRQAEERLRGQLSVPSAGPKDLSKYERDKAVND
jgi:hypothetical protein